MSAYAAILTGSALNFVISKGLLTPLNHPKVQAPTSLYE